MSDTFFVSLSNFHNSRWPPIACVYRNHHRTLTLCTILINLGSNNRFLLMLDPLSMVPLTSNVHIKVIWQDHGYFGSKVQQNIIFYFTQCLIFNILISHVDLMAEYCVFKCVLGKCPMKQKLPEVSLMERDCATSLMPAFSMVTPCMLTCRSNWTPTKTCKRVITGLASPGIKHMHQNLKQVKDVPR